MSLLLKIIPNYIGWGEVPVKKSLDVADIRVALIQCKRHWAVQLLRSVKGDKKLWSIVKTSHHSDEAEAIDRYRELTMSVIICDHVHRTTRG